MENFLSVYLALADEWKVWDNEGDQFMPLANSHNTTADQIAKLLTKMTLQETTPKEPDAATKRAMLAMQLAYEDAKAENKRWGFLMIPQEWDPVRDAGTSWVIAERVKAGLPARGFGSTSQSNL